MLRHVVILEPLVGANQPAEVEQAAEITTPPPRPPQTERQGHAVRVHAQLV